MSGVWIVTAGAYSDYHMVAAFSSEEMAKAFLEGAHLNDSQVEEIELDRPGIVGLQSYELKMGWDGVVDCITEGSATTFESKMDEFDEEELRGMPAFADTKIFSGVQGWDIWARDEQHAIKILNEYRLQRLAEKGMS